MPQLLRLCVIFFAFVSGNFAIAQSIDVNSCVTSKYAFLTGNQVDNNFIVAGGILSPIDSSKNEIELRCYPFSEYGNDASVIVLESNLKEAYLSVIEYAFKSAPVYPGWKRVGQTANGLFIFVYRKSKKVDLCDFMNPLIKNDFFTLTGNKKETLGKPGPKGREVWFEAKYLTKIRGFKYDATNADSDKERGLKVSRIYNQFMYYKPTQNHGNN